jgi:hypothetical protein
MIFTSQEFVKLLGTRAVAYLNVDYVMDGNMSLYAGAMPTMNEFIMKSAKIVRVSLDKIFVILHPSAMVRAVQLSAYAPSIRVA